jgi:excisionase family DNA binding protein
MSTVEAVRCYTAVEAGAVLAISDDSIYRLAEDGELRMIDISRVGRKILRVRADDLQAFIDRRTPPLVDASESSPPVL